MKRSRLRNKLLNTKNDIDRKAYDKQLNYIVSLLRNDKKNFYSNLDAKAVTDNRTFWQTIKPLLSEKVIKQFKSTWLKTIQLFLVTTRLLKSSVNTFKNQKQPSRGVFMRRSSENMQQIYRGTPLLKFDFNKVAKQFLMLKFSKNPKKIQVLKLSKFFQ